VGKILYWIFQDACMTDTRTITLTDHPILRRNTVLETKSLGAP